MEGKTVYYKNKLGFTLIELLAVIVILAIIALIATPIVMNIISDAKISANERSAENYMRAVENAIVKERMNGNFNPSSCIISSNNDKSIVECDEVALEVEVSGKLPKGGYIQIQDGQVVSYNVEINNQVASSIKDFKVWDGRKKEPTLDGNTYHINEASELAWVADQTNSGNTFKDKTLLLESNLDLNNRDWISIGNQTNSFQGVFEGNSNTIKNIYIKKQDSGFGYGLFGFAQNAIIENVIIDSSNITGISGVSTLVGVSFSSIINNVIVSNSGVKYNIDSNNIKKGEYLGGIVGWMSKGTITNSKVINLKAEGTSNVGGVIGQASESTIKNLYVDSKTYVEGARLTGGIVVQMHTTSTMSDTTVKGIVKGGIYVGGVVGNSATSNISKAYVVAKIYFTDNNAGAIAGNLYQGKIENSTLSTTINDVKSTIDNIIGGSTEPITLNNNRVE